MCYLKNITYTLMILAAISLLTAYYKAACGGSKITAGELLFYLFMMLPFGIVWRINLKLYLGDASKASRLSIFITSLLMTVLCIAVSFESFFGKTSSTSALVFFFVPIYLLLMIAVFYPLLRLILNYVIHKGANEKGIE